MLKSLVRQALRQLGYMLVRIDPSIPATGAAVIPPATAPRASAPSLEAFISPVPLINIVDVGAMFAGDGIEPYSALRDAGLARVVGFEPVAAECAKLNQRFGPSHRYLPYAIGDGTTRRLHVCNESMTSSLYEPNTELLSAFDGLEEVVRVVREVSIETHRLDDVVKAEEADYLKLDVQGAEVDVLRGASRLLANAVVVHTEVEFVPLYLNQPLFADVDQMLRKAGYGLFALAEIQSRAYKPFRAIDLAPSPRLRQALWADAIYVRALFELDRLNADDLVRLFVILHMAYGATDLCTRVLKHLDARTGDTAAVRYRAEALAGLRLG